MKKLGWLTILAIMLLGTAARADGIDLKAQGTWDFVFGWNTNSNFRSDSGRDNDNFMARQRIRPQINFIASEYLQGVLMFEIQLDWGRDGGGKVGPSSGGGIDADGVNVRTRRAYLDWVVPGTDLSLRMGLQGVSLPMANGYLNPVFSTDVAGIVANVPLNDMIGLTAFWLRPFNQNLNDVNAGPPNSLNDEMDMFGLTLPVSGNGWSVTPWAMYSAIGNASGYYEYISSGYSAPGEIFVGRPDNYSADTAHAWWLGLSAQIDIWDPLSFGFDVMYGHMSKAESGAYMTANGTAYDDDNALFDDEIGARGWFVDAALNYKLDWGTPGIFGWYASGDDHDDFDEGWFGRMPVVGVDDGFTPTTFGFTGSYTGITSNGMISMTGMGTWGIGLQIADVAFVEDLRHTLRVAYYRGTNDHAIIQDFDGRDFVPHFSAENIYLTDKDSVVEVNFDHQYKIYENLTAVLELGYIKLNLDDETWRENETDNAWKGQVIFRYQF